LRKFSLTKQYKLKDLEQVRKAYIIIRDVWFINHRIVISSTTPLEKEIEVASIKEKWTWRFLRYFIDLAKKLELEKEKDNWIS